ncbi:MAG TPA: small multi-drug export protein [Methanocorpusculum sp.]|nr:small multi-drug export protein [Methanocorpusculum sp.]
MVKEGCWAQKWTKVILHRILFLGGPLAVYGLFLFSMWFVYPPTTGIIGHPSPEYLGLLGILIIYLVPPFGKESVIPVAIGLIPAAAEGIPVAIDDFFAAIGVIPSAIGDIPPWIICFGIILMDMMSSILIALNFDILEKIPFVGSLIHRLVAGADSVRKKKPWIEQCSHLGLLIFMYLPFQGSGAITTTILGRLLGVKAWTVFWIVTVGSILSTLSIAFGAAGVRELWRINPWFAGVAILVIAVVIIAAILVWRRYTKRLSPDYPAGSCDSDEEDILP